MSPKPIPPKPIPAANEEAPKPRGSSFIDTGTGGFPLGPDNARYVYDLGIESEDGQKGNWNRGDINVNVGPSDISVGTKRTLASYLSKVTMAQEGAAGAATVKNAYEITDNYSEVSLTDKNGFPAPPTSGGGGRHFTLSNFSSISDKYREANPPQNPNFVKGKNVYGGQPGVSDGNSLLQGIPLSGVVEAGTSNKDGYVLKHGEIGSPNSTIYKYSRAVLNNRFSPYSEKDSLKKFSNSDSPGDLKPRSSAEQLFNYKYEKGVSPTTNEARQVSMGQLAQLGSLLTLRAGSEIGSKSAGSSTADVGAGTLLPGWTQVGLKRVEPFILEAEDILKSLTNEGVPEQSYIKPTELSWGALNNTEDGFTTSPYGGLAMILLAAALILAFGIAFGVFALLPFVPPTDPSVDKQPAGLPRKPGVSSRNSANNWGGPNKSISVNSLFGGFKSEYPVWECAFLGFLAYFNMSIENPREKSQMYSGLGTIGLAKDALDLGIGNAGFAVVHCRVLNRSILSIADAATSMNFSSAALAAGSIINFIQTLYNSKFVGALRSFAIIGDTILRDPKGFDDRVNSGEDSGPGPWSFTKGRIKDGKSTTTLSWSTHRAIDGLILPSGIMKTIQTGDLLGAPTYLPTENESLRTKDGREKLSMSTYYKVDTGRIDSDTRESLENYLESEYVPFYFHDVRTNEIVSFHAFLASLTDDYSVSTDQTDAFGRVEPIKTYKSTSRKIGFSFYVAALSEKDFDNMWIKVNKLTTLVYPQFTQGTHVTSPDGKYVMTAPFSQQISAAPLTRIRIGDLIRSNYSKFNLARMFGYGDPSSVINGNPFVPGDATYAEDPRYKKHLEDNAQKYSWEVPKDVLGPGGKPIPDGYTFKVQKLGSTPTGLTATCVVAEPDPQDNGANKKIVDAKRSYGEDYNKLVGNHITDVSYSELTLTKKSKDQSMKDFIETISPEAISGYQDAVNNFMSDSETDKGNAISKSFKTVGGRGLAGLIESMSFDWYDKVTWETSRGMGYKAPKMCKVNVSFFPIHDITPGLDHNGFNRAAIYPVGPLAPRNPPPALPKSQ